MCRRAAGPSKMWPLVGLATLITVLALAAVYRLRLSPPLLSRYPLMPLYAGEDATFSRILWSADGSSVAFATQPATHTSLNTYSIGLRIRHLSSPESALLFSRSLSRGEVLFPVRWLPDGYILFVNSSFSNDKTSTLHSISNLGGDPLVALDALPPFARDMDVSPDGKTAAFFCACDALPSSTWAAEIVTP